MGELFECVPPKTALAWTDGYLTHAATSRITMERLHLYIAARDLCRGSDVLDVASGEGYGTALLAQVAGSIIGVDSSTEAVGNATSQWKAANLRYLQGDAHNLPLPDASVDVAISFGGCSEQDQPLEEIRRVLKPGGLLVASCAEPTRLPPSEKESSQAEFERRLRSRYRNVSLFCQHTLVGSVLLSGEAGPVVTVERRGARQFERSDGLARAPCRMALASDAPLPAPFNSLYLASSHVGPLLARAAEHPALTAALAEARERAEAAQTALRASRADAPPGAPAPASGDACIAALTERIDELMRRTAAAELEAREWSTRYYALHGALQRLYVRSGLFGLLRLVPRPIRQSLGKAVLSSRR